MAVELKHKQIISYLLYDAKADPNALTTDTYMAPLHIAVQLKLNEIIELLLTLD